jgi:hypothetical protein
VERINQTSELTLHRLKDELAARGVMVSHNAVWLFLRHEGLSFKKTLFALEQARAEGSRRVSPFRRSCCRQAARSVGVHAVGLFVAGQ